MNAAKWDKLPLLLKSRDVRLVTGWDDRLFYKLLKAGVIKPVIRCPVRGDYFFRKADFCKTVGLPL